MVNAGEPLYIICKNLTDVFRAEKALTGEGVRVRAVPSPPKEAGHCSTVLEISPGDLNKSQGVLKKFSIEIRKIVPGSNRSVLLNKLKGFQVSSSFSDALSRIMEGSPPSLPDVRVLLEASGENRQQLWQAADIVRRASIGDVVDIRAALEFSNHCRQNCLYCGLRISNRKLARYRMTEAEIIEQSLKIKAMGIRTIILQSGEDPWFTTEKIVSIIKGIKNKTGMRITLSLGERQPEEYTVFKEAGADNYLLKVETTDPGLYSALHPNLSVVNRMEHIRIIKKTGYITGSGNIIGLPGQDLDSIARDIIWCWQEGIHMIGIGPFVPAPGTPLEDCTPGAVDITLNTIAVTRLVCTNSFIPSTTALATLDREAQIKGLACGANTVMLIMTPPGIREKYMIYGNKMMVDLEWALTMIDKLGRKTPPYLKERGIELVPKKQRGDDVNVKD